MNCKLYSIDGRHDPIGLIDNNLVFIGRGPDTKITEKKCSRQHVQLIANCEKKKVYFTQLGLCPTTIGSLMLNRGDTQTLGPGALIGLLNGKYKYSIQFLEPFNNFETEDAKCERYNADFEPPVKTLKVSRSILENNGKTSVSVEKHTDVCHPKNKLQGYKEMSAS